jgi:hypothetical protein
MLLRRQIEPHLFWSPKLIPVGFAQVLVAVGVFDRIPRPARCQLSGVGKSWLASALGHKACRDNRSVLYQRVPRLFEALALGRGDGRHPRLLRNLGRADLLILDLCAARSDVERYRSPRY